MEAIVLVPCPRCELVFETNAACCRHATQEHLEKTPSGRFQCIFCTSTLVTIESLWSHHWYAHTTTRLLYVCKICDLEFPAKKPLDEHRAVHTASDYAALKCPNCPRTFVSFTRLKRHREFYYDETPEGLLPCHGCGKRFKTPTERKKHEMHIHIAPDAYACSFPGCLKACPSPYALASHLKTHETGRPYKCPHCIRWFKEKKQFARHTLSLHPVVRPSPNPDKPFQCSSCVKSFSRNRELGKHVQRFHQQENSKWEKRLHGTQ